MAINQSVDRFCRQCLQLEQALDYPAGDLLRQSDIQGVIYNNLFSSDTVRFPLPPRYQIHILKKLLSLIEASIVDWEEYVSWQALKDSAKHNALTELSGRL